MYIDYAVLRVDLNQSSTVESGVVNAIRYFVVRGDRYVAYAAGVIRVIVGEGHGREDLLPLPR